MVDSIKDRVDNVTDNTKLSLYDFPESAKIEITGKCTLNCNFCYNHEMKMTGARQRNITLDEFDCILNFLQKIPSIKEVGLFYIGESSLNSNMPLFYKKLKEKKYFTFLTTNGTIFDVIKDSIKYIDSLKISWNYKNIEDFINKTGSTYDMFSKIKNNIFLLYDECHKYNKKLNISTVLDSKREDYSDILKTLKYDEHYWIPLQNQCGFCDKGLGGVVGEDDNRRSTIPCWSLFKSLYVDSELNIRTCTYGHYEDNIVGNINDYVNLDKISIPKKILDMRQQHLKGEVPSECSLCLNK